MSLLRRTAFSNQPSSAILSQGRAESHHSKSHAYLFFFLSFSLSFFFFFCSNADRLFVRVIPVRGAAAHNTPAVHSFHSLFQPANSTNCSAVIVSAAAAPAPPAPPAPAADMPAYLEDPSVLTKDKLKSELLAHNVELPTGNPTKDVFVQLYLEKLTALNQHHYYPGVTTTAASLDSFSSDEELPPPPVVSNSSRSSGRVRR